jgi:hypothetical protein
MTKFNEEADDYTVRLVRESDAAWLVNDGADSDALEARLPKSKCEFPRGCRPGQTVTVTVPNWLAEEKGMLG